MRALPFLLPTVVVVACSAGGEEGRPGPGQAGSSAGASSGSAGSGGAAAGAGAGGSGGVAGGNGGAGGSAAGDGGQGGGANGGSAGTGAGESGAAGSAGAAGSGSPPANLLLSDGFETVAALGPPDATVWTRRLGFGGGDDPSTIVIDDTNAHGGSQSVRVTGTDSIREIVAEVPVDRLFVRVWLQMTAASSGSPVLIGIGGDQNQDIRLRLWEGQLGTLNTGAGDGVAPTAATSGNCPACVTIPDGWFCAEMFVENSTETATLWIDGAEAASVSANAGWHVASTWPTFPSPTNVRIGFWGLGGAQATVWIDDVAIAEERIGCD